MNVTKPDYYDEFMCTAGECSFTCCQQWSIGVDEHTKDRWAKMGIDIAALVKNDWSGDHICLNEDGFCPFLTSEKLCKIVCDYGEDAISETCHTFPREKHEFSNLTEYTLAMGCPEALRLLLERGLTFHRSENKDVQAEDYPSADETLIFIRENICSLLQNKDYTLAEALQISFLLMLDFDEVEQSDAKLSKEYVYAQFSESTLFEIKKAINDVKVDFTDHILEQNELFLDLVDNYRKKNIYEDVIEPLAQMAEAFEPDTFEGEFQQKRKEYQSCWEEIDSLCRVLLAEEVYSTLYLPGADTYSMLIKFQWIGIFYAVLKQMCFLDWCNHGAVDFSKIVTVLVRMTGYSDADIEEYLENSFEEIIWDWGYMALIVGEP